MSKLNLAPTKSNQLRLRRESAIAHEGFLLLEQKREILIVELMKILEQSEALSRERDRLYEIAMNALRQAIAQNGMQVMNSFSLAMTCQNKVDIDYVSRVGVKVPVVSVSGERPGLQYSMVGSDSLLDRVSFAMEELFRVNVQVARLEISLWVLARELRRTQRRVNALEQIFIPELLQTLKYIGESLESKELESFAVMKLVKRKLSALRGR